MAQQLQGAGRRPQWETQATAAYTVPGQGEGAVPILGYGTCADYKAKGTTCKAAVASAIRAG